MSNFSSAIEPARFYVNDNHPLPGDVVATLLKSSYHLSQAEVMFALNLPGLTAYKQITACEILPLEKELMIRFYDRHPGFVPWSTTTMTPRLGFKIVYGKALAAFDGMPEKHTAEMELRRRFVRALGKSLATAHRWLGDDKESSDNDSDSGWDQDDELSEEPHTASRCILTLFRLLSTVENPQEVFDSITRQTLLARGIDLDAELPLPDPLNPPSPRKRGRRFGSVSKKKLAAMAAAAAAAAAPAAPAESQSTAQPDAPQSAATTEASFKASATSIAS